MPHVDTPGSVITPAASVSRESMTATMRKVVPLEVGTATLVAGKVTIPATAVTATGAIIVTSEGPLALSASVLSVTERKAGVSFTVESLLATSTNKVNYAIYE